MNEEQIRSIVDSLVRQFKGDGAVSVMEKEYKEIEKPVLARDDAPVKGEIIDPEIVEKANTVEEKANKDEDITEINLKTWYLVDNPKDKDAFMDLKGKTTARIGVGRAGARYKTKTMLRVRADHAAAQDTVFSHVSEDFIKEQNMVPVQTLCKDKDEYLTRPDLGRRFSPEEMEKIKSLYGTNPQVLLIVGDGLSSSAIEANVADMVPAVKQGLKMYGIDVGDILFIQYARVGAMDDIGQATGAKVICMLVGERPGLVTAESMSAYITYEPRHGIPESKRTVISNIHKGGTNAVEAGAHAAELIHTMLEKKASGVELKLLEQG